MESHVRQLETFCGTVMLYDPDRIHGSGYVDTDLDTLPYMSPKIKQIISILKDLHVKYTYYKIQQKSKIGW